MNLFKLLQADGRVPNGQLVDNALALAVRVVEQVQVAFYVIAHVLKVVVVAQPSCDQWSRGSKDVFGKSCGIGSGVVHFSPSKSAVRRIVAVQTLPLIQ